MFANKIKKLKAPLVFKVDGFRIMAMGGFELHFDPFWKEVTKKKIDLVLLPTTSTFESHNQC